MTFDFTDAPIIYSYETKAMRNTYASCYAATLGISAARLVVMEPCPLLFYGFLKQFGEDYYPRLEVALRASLCIKDECGHLMAIAFYDTTTEAEAARLQFIKDYNIENREDYNL